MKSVLMLFLAALTGSFGVAFAQQGVILSDKAGWHKIAEKTVDFSKDRDDIYVVGNDKFSAVKFMVTDAAIHLNSLEISFETGNTQSVKINTPIKAAGESRTIDLDGGEREIKKIMFVYNTLPNSKAKKATVQVWGKKEAAAKEDKVSNAAQPSSPNTLKTTNSPNPEQTSEIPSPAVVTADKTGWNKIGGRSVEFVRDRDEILVVGANRFSAIKFKAMDAPVHIMAVELQYAAGDNQKVSTGFVLEKGMESPEIVADKGKERDLEKITFVYKTLPNSKNEKAAVEIWGYKTNAETSTAAH